MDVATTFLPLGGFHVRPCLRTCMDAPVPQRDLFLRIPLRSWILLLSLRSDGKETGALPLLCKLCRCGQPVCHRSQLLDDGHHQVHDGLHQRRNWTGGVCAHHGIRRTQRTGKSGTGHPLLLHRWAVLVARRCILRAQLEGAHGLLFSLRTALLACMLLASRIAKMAPCARQTRGGQDRPGIHGRSEWNTSWRSRVHRPSTGGRA
mmetsp:Transcript_9362/g.57072  ORF Transcript_9362/g.57072 Transcript_9362/m.57072 type:complete len:205 (+) Transcript_9362:445-1059(+)